MSFAELIKMPEKFFSHTTWCSFRKGYRTITQTNTGQCSFFLFGLDSTQVISPTRTTTTLFFGLCQFGLDMGLWVTPLPHVPPPLFLFTLPEVGSLDPPPPVRPPPNFFWTVRFVQASKLWVFELPPPPARYHHPKFELCHF